MDDVGQLQATFPQWEIVRLLSNEIPWPYPPDGALTYVRDVALPAMDAGTLWMWTVRLKSDPERIIGFNPYARLADFLIAEAHANEQKQSAHANLAGAAR